MTKRQTEELAKLYLDVGKLIYASFVLGFFQYKTNLFQTLLLLALGLTLSIGFFIVGLRLFKEVK